jgi:hypothetical protein
MSGRDKAEIIRGIFAAYLSNDRKAVETALADDFRFTSPYDDRIDKASYFERCWHDTGWIERHELEKILVQGDEAFVTYNCVAKGGRNFRNTEVFVSTSISAPPIRTAPSSDNPKIEPRPACRLPCISIRWHHTATRR